MIVFQVPLESIRPPLTFSQNQLICARGIQLNRICTASYVAPPNAQALRYEQR